MGIGRLSNIYIYYMIIDSEGGQPTSTIVFVCIWCCMCVSHSIDQSVSQWAFVASSFLLLLFWCVSSFSYSVRQGCSYCSHWRGGVEDALFRFSPPSSWSCMYVCNVASLSMEDFNIYIYIYLYRRWMVIVQLLPSLFLFSLGAVVRSFVCSFFRRRLFDQGGVQEWEEKNL